MKYIKLPINNAGLVLLKDGRYIAVKIDDFDRDWNKTLSIMLQAIERCEKTS